MATNLTYLALGLLAASSAVHCAAAETNSGSLAGGLGSGGAGQTTGMGGEGAFNPNSAAGGQGGACVDLLVEGETQLRAVDIIFIVDNSGSMSEENAAVEANINNSFAQVMKDSGIDYRIIMLAWHGAAGVQVCIKQPLSGTTDCDAPPINVPNQFYHYSVQVESHDSLCVALRSFTGELADHHGQAPGGWQQWLRPEAVKVFIEVSDDGSNCDYNGVNIGDLDTVQGGQLAAMAFDNALLTLSPEQFGTASERNYMWYSIVALKPKDVLMPLQPWEPSDPVTTDECTPGAVDPGTTYQWLSKMTGALRFPVCDPSGYDVLFQDIANGIEERTTVPCELALPEAPMGQQLDLNTVSVMYTPMGTGTPVDLDKVDGPDQCGAGNFYVEDELIKICPQACSVIEADVDAQVQIKLACGGEPN